MGRDYATLYQVVPALKFALLVQCLFILLSCEVVCEVYSLSEVACEVYLLCEVCEVYSHCEVVCEAYCLLTPLVSVHHMLLGTLPSSCTAIW